MPFTKSVDPLTLHSSAPTPPKASTIYKENLVAGWIKFNGEGTILIVNSFNVSSIDDNGTGFYDVNWDTDLVGDYASVAISNRVSSTVGVVCHTQTQQAGEVQLRLHRSDNGAAVDRSAIKTMAVGAQS